jgi:hypothetical protein
MDCDLQAAVAEWLVTYRRQWRNGLWLTGGSGGIACDLQASVAEWLLTYRRQWRNDLWLTGEAFHCLQFYKTLNASFFRCQPNLGQEVRWSTARSMHSKKGRQMTEYIATHIMSLRTAWRWVVSFTPRPLYSPEISPRNPLNTSLCASVKPEGNRTKSSSQLSNP